MYESVESPESCKLLYVIAQSRIMVVVDDDDVDDDDDVNDDDDVVVVNCVDLVAKKKRQNWKFDMDEFEIAKQIVDFYKFQSCHILLKDIYILLS